MLQRANGAWAPPGGLVEADETPLDCAVRETFEETGLQVVGVPDALYEWVWTGRRVHVHQFIALAPDGDVVISEEHRGFQWFDLDAFAAWLAAPAVASTLDALRWVREMQVIIGRAREWLAAGDGAR